MARRKTSTKTGPLVDEYGFKLHPVSVFSDREDLSREIRNEQTLVTDGNWVLITKSPMCEHAPQVYGIYWAMPFLRKGAAGVQDPKTKFYTHITTKDLVGVDEFGRQCALIYTPNEVRIFPDEYSILSEEKVQAYRQMGWQLHQTGANLNARHSMNMELIEKGRSLVEEEREVIWALQLDGLSESQACEEYFLTHHTKEDNTAICYLPDEETLSIITSVFGTR